MKTKTLITPEYHSWKGMLARCRNPNTPGYNNYGGRGIKVCESWHTFSNFLEDMGKRPARNFSIERLDNSSGYCKENCIWADDLTQMNNTRWNHRVTYNGDTKTLSQWSRELNIKVKTLFNRLNRYSWSVERAFSVPVGSGPWFACSLCGITVHNCHAGMYIRASDGSRKPVHRKCANKV